MNKRAESERGIGRALVFAIAVAVAFPALVEADGVTQAWVKRYDGPANGHDWAKAIAVDGGGNVYVTGESLAANGKNDYATIKYLSDGKRAWVMRYNGPANGDDIAKAIAVDGSGNVYVTGESLSASGSDYATIRYKSDGTQKWVKRYNGPANANDYAQAIAVDGGGNVAVTGYSEGAHGFDYATVKYLRNGTLSWAKRYNGPANGNDSARAIAMDGGGNVYVTGESGAANGKDNYATIRYLSNGTQAWVKRYNGPANNVDQATAIVADGGGNVYVTGKSDGEASSFDYATIKYESDGSQAWEKRFNGKQSGWDSAEAITVDGNGNVYLTGQSTGSDGSSDYTTIKYLSSGARAWVICYNGPGGNSDGAKAIAVDGSGNVYVTGNSHDTTGVYDFATIKYRPN